LVKAFKISGASVIDGAELESLVAPHVGRDMGLAELEEIAGLVTAEFGDRGYTLARAYIPAQDIKDGIVEIVVVEGKVGEIIVKGNKNYSTDFIKRGFTPVVEQSAIKHSSLEKSLLLLNEYPDLKLKATLEAGKEPGTTDIVATVEDRLPVHLTVDYDNFGTESVSKNRFGMEVNTIVDGTKRQGNFTFRPDRALPAGVRTPAFSFLFSRLQMPAEQHFLKRELHTEHSILVQLKQLHGFPN
jgi:hemolysin activation/secretion protein